MLYRAKNDGLVKVVAGLAAVALAVVGVWLVYAGVEVATVPEPVMLLVTLKSTPFMLLLGALLPLFGVILIWCLAATRYEISLQHLIIQSGPSLRRIRLDSIVAARVAPGGLPRGPIWSQQMVRIEHRRGKGRRVASIVISPHDTAGFLKALALAAPALQAHADDSLLAAASRPEVTLPRP
jgi:hypothetical protein